MDSLLKDRLKKETKLSFFDVIQDFHNLDGVISLFLAILELTRHHKIIVKQSRDFGDLILERRVTNGN